MGRVGVRFFIEGQEIEIDYEIHCRLANHTERTEHTGPDIKAPEHTNDELRVA